MNVFWFLKPNITYHSKVNGTLTIGKTYGNKALFSGGVTQSGGEITLMYHTIIQNFYLYHVKPKNILILGMAGGTVIKEIRLRDKTADITAIEIDPTMIKIAKKQFHIRENKKQNIIICDAITYLFTKAPFHVYDLIIVDLYIGPRNPEKSRTKSFMLQLKKLLIKNGTVLYNSHYVKNRPKEYNQFLKITESIFTDVHEVFSYPLNRVVLMR